MLSLKSQGGKMYALLSARRRERVSILLLHNVSGSLAVSTIISQLRKRYDLVIKNKEVRQSNRIVFSYFKLVKGTVKNVVKK